MAYACIDKIFDIQVKPLGVTRVLISDSSVWRDPPEGEGSSDTVELKLFSMLNGMSIRLPIRIKGSTVITSKELYGTENEELIEDDILCFEIFNCGDTFKIQRALLGQVMCKIDTLIANAVDVKDRERITEYRLMAKAIESLSENGRVEDARDTYRVLQKKLDNVTCQYC